MDTFDENEEKNESNVMSLSYDRQIHVIAGYNNIIYKKDENAFKKDIGEYARQYKIYKLAMDDKSMNIVIAMCTLTGFFAQKAIVGTYNSNFKMSYSCRFLPITDLCVPQIAKMNKTTSFSSVVSSSTAGSSKGGGVPTAAGGGKIKRSVVFLRSPQGDTKHSLMSTIDLNQRITDRNILKWTIQLLESVVTAHSRYITLGSWDSSNIVMIADDSILESFQEIRAKVYSDVLERSSSRDNRAVSVNGGESLGEESDDSLDDRASNHIKGRKSRDAWFSFAAHLNNLKNSNTTAIEINLRRKLFNEAYIRKKLRTKMSPEELEKAINGLKDSEDRTHLFSVLHQHDPQHTGCSDISRTDTDFSLWEIAMEYYLIRMLRDFRTLGIIIIELNIRRSLSQQEKALLHSVAVFQFSDLLNMFPSVIDRVPSLMKDLLRLCFSSSPYELAVDPSKNLIDAKDEDRTYFSSMESSAGSSIFSSSFQVFSAGSMSSGELMHSSSGINDGTASHSNVPLIVPTKKGFSSMELFTKHMKKPMQCRVGEVIVKKIKLLWTEIHGLEWGKYIKLIDRDIIPGYTDAMELKRVNTAELREERNAKLVEEGRQLSIERVNKHINSVMFEMLPEEEQRRILNRQAREKESKVNARRRKQLIHKAYPHGWNQSEISDWIRKAIVNGFQSLRALLPHFKPKRKIRQSSGLPPIKDASQTSLDNDNDTDFDAAEDPESGPKYDVALRYLVLESISAFNRCQKKIQFFVDSGADLDASSIATKESSHDSDGSGNSDEETASISTRPRARTSSNLESVADGGTMPALVASQDSMSVASSGVSSTNKKMSKINKLSGLLGLRTFKSPKNNQKKKDKNKAKANIDDEASDAAGNIKTPIWDQPFKRKETQEEIDLKFQQCFSFLGGFLGKYLSTRSAPGAYKYRIASQQVMHMIYSSLNKASVQLEKNEIVRLLPRDQRLVKIRFLALDYIVDQWKDLRDCLLSFTKKCEVFENVRDLVNRLMRAVGYSFIEQYDRDASERLLGEITNLARLVAFFRGIVVRKKVKRIWFKAEAEAKLIIEKRELQKKIEAEQEAKRRTALSSPSNSDAIARAKRRLALSDSAAQIESRENIDPRWLFFASLLDAFVNKVCRKNNKKELLAPIRSSNSDSDSTSLKLPADHYSINSIDKPISEHKSTDIIKLNELPMEISRQLTVLFTPSPINLHQAILSQSDATVGQRPRFNDAIVVRHAGFTAEKTMLNESYIANHRRQKSKISSKDDHLSELLRASKLIDVYQKATRDTKYSLFQQENSEPSPECGLVRVMLGVDFRSSSWGLSENLVNIGAIVLLNVDDGRNRNCLSGVQGSVPKLTVIIDELWKLRCISSSVIEEANDICFALKLDKSTTHRTHRLPNLVPLALYGIVPIIGFSEVPYETFVADNCDDESGSDDVSSTDNRSVQFRGSDEGSIDNDLVRVKKSQALGQTGVNIASSELEGLVAAENLLQPDFNGWTCINLFIPGLVPNKPYQLEIQMGSHLIPDQKFRGMGIRIPVTEAFPPERMKLSSNLVLPKDSFTSEIVRTPFEPSVLDENPVIPDIIPDKLLTIEAEVVRRTVVIPSTNTIRACRTVPNAPLKLKIELRRLANADDSTRESISRRSRPLSITDVVEKDFDIVSCRVSWLSATSNGLSVTKYSIQRKLLLLITAESSICSSAGDIKGSSTRDDCNSHPTEHARIPSESFVMVVEEWADLVEIDTSSDHASDLSISPLFDNLYSMVSDGSTDSEEKKTPEMDESRRYEVGCAYSDIINERQTLEQSLKLYRASIPTYLAPRQKKRVQNDRYQEEKESHVFLVCQYRVKAINAIGPSQWSSVCSSNLTQFGRRLSYLLSQDAPTVMKQNDSECLKYALSQRGEIDSESVNSNIPTFDAKLMKKKKKLNGIQSALFSPALPVQVHDLKRQVTAGIADTMSPKLNTILLNNNSDVNLKIIDANAAIKGHEQNLDKSSTNIFDDSGDTSLKSTETLSVSAFNAAGLPSESEKLSFLERIAQASPLAPRDADYHYDDEYNKGTNKMLPQSTKTPPSDASSSIFEEPSFSGKQPIYNLSGTEKILKKLQLYSESKDISVVPNVKRYQSNNSSRNSKLL